MLRFLQPFRQFASSGPVSNASKPKSAGSADSDLELARQWLRSFDSHTIPRHLGQISFSRSSGPGGQNVNKSVHVRSPSLDAGLTKWRQSQFQGNPEAAPGRFATSAAVGAARSSTGLALCRWPGPGSADPV
jgi:hypothetical protein